MKHFLVLQLFSITCEPSEPWNARQETRGLFGFPLQTDKPVYVPIVVPHFSNGTPILLPLCGTTW